MPSPLFYVLSLLLPCLSPLFFIHIPLPSSFPKVRSYYLPSPIPLLEHPPSIFYLRSVFSHFIPFAFESCCPVPLVLCHPLFSFSHFKRSTLFLPLHSPSYIPALFQPPSLFPLVLLPSLTLFSLMVPPLGQFFFTPFMAFANSRGICFSPFFFFFSHLFSPLVLRALIASSRDSRPYVFPLLPFHYISFLLFTLFNIVFPSLFVLPFFSPPSVLFFS